MRTLSLKVLSSATAPHLIEEVCTFVRNILIARLLGAEALGEFIIIIMTLRLLIMSSDLALDRYLIKQPSQKLKISLANSHAIQMMRSILIAITFCVMGMYNVYGLSLDIFILLSMIILVHGVTHKGYQLEQRDLLFKKSILINGLIPIVGLVLICIAISAYPSLKSVFVVLVIQSVMRMGMSHFLSPQKFMVIIDRKEMLSILSFGFPLLLSGVIMFWSMQGERIILSTHLTLSDFAHLSILLQLALVPALLLGKVSLSIGIPTFARAQNQQLILLDLIHNWDKAFMLLSILFVVSFLLLANPFLELVFGTDYRAEITILCLVAFLQALRILRTPRSVASQALGHSGIPLKANLIRVVGTLIGACFMMVAPSVNLLLTIALISEIIAHLYQNYLFKTATHYTINITMEQKA